MPILPLALPSGSNKGREAHAGIAALINCYAEQAGTEQRSPMQIWAAPGLHPLVTMGGTGGVRCLTEVDGLAYAVVGRTLYQIDSGGAVTTLGGIPSDGYVGVGRNQRSAGVQIVFVCDGLKWVVAGGTLSSITDPDLPPANDVCVINGSAIFGCPDGRMFRSEINDATSVDALDTESAEGVPDGLLRVVDRGGDLIVIGARSVEVWTDVGGEAFGFARAQVIRVGAVGARSVTKASVITGGVVTDTVAWVASDKDGAPAGIVMLDGYQPRKISELWIERLIQETSDRTAIVATSWVSYGMGFIAFRFPDTTVVYNTTTQRWHERQSRTTGGAATTWRVSHATVLGGRVLVGDYDNPKLYWLDEDTYDEDGDELVVTVRTPPMVAYPGSLEINRLWLDAVPGVGLVSGSAQDTAPQVMMRFSRDNETWSTQRSRALGAAGARNTRLSWTSLGTVDQATIEFSCSAAVVRGFLGAGWDGETIKP